MRSFYLVEQRLIALSDLYDNDLRGFVWHVAGALRIEPPPVERLAVDGVDLPAIHLPARAITYVTERGLVEPASAERFAGMVLAQRQNEHEARRGVPTRYIRRLNREAR